MSIRETLSSSILLAVVPPALRGAFLDFRPHFLAALEQEKVTNLNWVAYLLSTAEGESGFRPVSEVRAGTNQPTIRALQDRYWASGYYGRGYVQLTWRNNYERMGRLLGVDLISNPDLALDPRIAAQILVIGCCRGVFTGLKLSDFDYLGAFDYFHARKIVNGLDRADHFASRGVAYLVGLGKALGMRK